MTAAKVWFGLMLLSGSLAIYFFKRPIDFNTLAFPVVQQAPVPLQVIQPAQPPVVIQPPASRQTVANLQDFQVSKRGDTDGIWVFQLDAREKWKLIPYLTVSEGDNVEFSATGIVCGPSVGCVGPNGQQAPAGTSLTRSYEFPSQDALFQSLIARIGIHVFQVGEHKIFLVPDGGRYQSVELMDNYRLPEISTANGGFTVEIKILSSGGAP